MTTNNTKNLSIFYERLFPLIRVGLRRYFNRRGVEAVNHAVAEKDLFSWYCQEHDSGGQYPKYAAVKEKARIVFSARFVIFTPFPSFLKVSPVLIHLSCHFEFCH